ncbi:MAG: alkaline phosphatase D family protein [Bacteroidetes bacterium]|nr:alkaline phosphatase D family protein [Bacteroidota bacterium]
MRHLSTILCFLLLFSSLQAQKPGDIVARTTLDSRFAPFYHGVASGDPMPDRVMIWTRVTTQDLGPIQVNWAMATDTGMTNVVRSGVATTSDTIDHTLKVDVTGLNAGTWYYYRFEYQGRYSLTGRTYTAPTGAVDSLRFGVVSCSNYEAGYFNAYGALAQRNDLYGIFHLGDYIYEGGGDGQDDRDHDPDHEIIDLTDYRIRHSQHKLDEDLRCLHQMYPFVTVWDDHESANDSYKDGAENHSPGSEGPWADRKTAAIQAYKEWMPLRDPDPGNRERIWRTLHYGNLMDLIMLDTRLYARDEQVSGGGIDDITRNLIGPEQLGWLSNELENSTAQWKVLGQQVMMAPLEVPFLGPVNTDQWDGYRAERQRLYDSILTKQIDNVVVLTGDIHSAWANDLPTGNYIPNTGAGSVGVEFVCTSITSTNSVVNVPINIINAANPHIKYVNLADHGYSILDLNQVRAQNDYWYVTNVSNANQYGDSWEESWYCADTTAHLQQAADTSRPSLAVQAIQPPKFPPNLAIAVDDPTTTDGLVALLGGYPNPFHTEFMLKYYLHANARVRIRLLDLNGRVIEEQNPGKQGTGLHIAEFSQPQLANGMYIAELSVNGRTTSQRMIKY